MKILAKLMLMVAMLGGAMAQTTSFWTDRAVGVSQFNGFSGLVPLQYAQVRVCSLPVNVASPCQPVAAVFDANGNPLPIAGGNFGQITTDIVGRFSFQAAPGNYQIQVAATGSNTPQLSYPITVTGVSNTIKVLEGIRYADQFANIQAAITDAGTTGGVIIPPNYLGTDAFGNSNNVFLQDQRKSSYANILKFNTYGLALNTGATINMFGDSLVCGQGPPTPTTQGFAYLVASSFGYVPNQQCTAGTQAQDAGQIDAIYATPITQTSISLWQPAYNDMRLNGVGGQPLLTAKNTILAGMLHLSVPDAFRVAGSSSACVPTGTWTTNPAYSGLPRVSTTNGDTIACTVRGNVIVPVLIAATGGGGQATIDVDGVTYGGTYNLFGYATSQLGRTYSPFPVVIRVPGTGTHLVTVHVVSPTNVANSVNLVEVISNGGGSDYAGPHAYLGQVLHMTAAGYAAGAPYNVGSDAAVDAYNGAFDDVCRIIGKEMHLGGLCVDNERYNPTLYASADNIHPGIVGEQVIADGYICRISGTTCSVEKSAINSTGFVTYFPIYSALPNNYGMIFSCPDGLNCQIGINRDPVTGNNLNPANAGFAINFDSGGSAVFYTAGAGAVSSVTRQFKIEAAGGISISATGTRIANHISATASLDFAAWAGGGDCQDLTIAVSGAADGDTVEIGVPTALSSTAGVQFTAWVSSANTVTVHGCKASAGASANPAAATVRADVWKH